MAGSWTKGWAGWWLRRWPQLPPPPHVWVWAEEPPKAFLLLWLLKRHRALKSDRRPEGGARGDTLGRLPTCETCAGFGVCFPRSTAKHSEWGLWCRWAAAGLHSPPHTSRRHRPRLQSDTLAWTESLNAWGGGGGDNGHEYTH